MFQEFGRETSARGTLAAASREDLSVGAYVAELYKLSYQAPQTGVRWNGTKVTRPRAHVSWILRTDAVGATR